MYTFEYYEYDWQHSLIAQRTFTTENKRYAWEEFKKSIAEHYNGKDFWDNINWNENLVETIHSAEDGYSSCVLHKWEGFDDEVSLAWKYGNIRCKSLKALWEAVPKFKDFTMECDEPYIRNSEDDTVAILDVEEYWPEK